MNAKLSALLKSFKAEFNSAFDLAPAVITPAAPAAPAVLAAPVSKDYTLLDGTVISVTQAGDVPAIGDTVTIMGTPAPDSVYSLEDGSTLTTVGGIITEVGAAAPVTTDLAGAPPVPTLEERISAIEAAIARATQPAAMSAEDADAIKKIKEDNAKLVKTVSDLFALIETIGTEPTADPVTLPESKTAKFKHIEKQEEKIRGYAEAITKINKNK